MSSGQQPPRRVTNVGSLLLTPQENESLFSFLGKKCVTMSSAVVQLYAADRNCMWSKKCSGVACLVKDNPQRSYFLRIFDIKDGKLLWEQELYNNFVYNSPRGYFHTFAGDTCQVALNFANEEEAKKFRKAVTDLLGRRQRKSALRTVLNGTGPSLYHLLRHNHILNSWTHPFSNRHGVINVNSEDIPRREQVLHC
ncbi:actin nucleation-promoting factor WASL isoform X2 [Arvicanthis niloticus]|uniref:actin nucleation-promoting factor WASL isoform X2 n=1 Tax=Arvicanthis niloticus TaxID=61156 RepID=UPI0014875CDE|nr:neural Wiskott-Aldrich syndrome protein isoform X2 [Arvicanthis niloticus]